MQRIFLIIAKGPGRFLCMETKEAKCSWWLEFSGKDVGLDDNKRGGEGNFLDTDGISNGVESIWTCILHLTSSIGVLTKGDQLTYQKKQRKNARYLMLRTGQSW